MNPRWLFTFFVASGFCSLVCEVVWLRLAMAGYGVTTALTSIVLSVFMGGLALGSWGGGRLAARWSSAPVTLLRLYALAETLIAVSASVVPASLDRGRDLLVTTGASWDSGRYHLASAAIITFVLLPFCASMGATFPLGVALLSRAFNGPGSFSYLYLANVIGATAGTLVSAFVLVESLGFTGTLAFVSGLNGLLGASALTLSLFSREAGAIKAGAVVVPARSNQEYGPWALWALFTTGLVSMGMEVVWIRQLTPYLGTVVYSFAIILGLYLGATFTGSAVYRRVASASTSLTLGPGFWVAVGLSGLLPLLATDPNAWFPAGLAGGVARAALAIVPFCGMVGFLTPLLTDRWSQGDPRRVGVAYALNVVGCVLGPLVAGFLLLPRFGERGTLLFLSAPLLLAGGLRSWGGVRKQRTWLIAGGMCAALLVLLTKGPESRVAGALVRHDSTATVTASGQGMRKQLRVNGVGMTGMTPITKMMTHLALGFHESQPRSALVICFGMGTSFRSALSWGVATTSVELVPSVPAFFGYFHSDAEELLRSPLARIVIDDGRRFLDRSADSFDAIIIDPPPPMEAAASSLLYSREFYRSARKRLAPGGVLQQWLPVTNQRDPLLVSAVVRALTTSFGYVRAFRSVKGWGIHLLASDEPLSPVTGEILAARLPARAAVDLLEWGPETTAIEQFSTVLKRELSVAGIIGLAPNAVALSDDRPVNEYFLLRRLLKR